jgi:hypothetical protein
MLGHHVAARGAVVCREVLDEVPLVPKGSFAVLQSHANSRMTGTVSMKRYQQLGLAQVRLVKLLP